MTGFHRRTSLPWQASALRFLPSIVESERGSPHHSERSACPYPYFPLTLFLNTAPGANFGWVLASI